MIKYTLIFKSVIFFSLLFAFTLFFTNKAIEFKEIIQPFEPFGSETKLQKISNSLLFLLFVIIASIILIKIVKLRKESLLNLILIYFPLFSTFILLSFFLEIIFYNSLIANIIAFSIIILLYISLSKKIVPIFFIGIILISSSIGSYLSISFRIENVIILLLIFMIYDVIAVFVGPLKFLVKELKLKKEVKSKKFYAFGFLFSNILGIGVGTGDFIFYSLALSAIYILKGIIFSLISLTFLFIGFWITILLLEKLKRPLPGLPIPLTLSLIVLFF